MDVLSIAGTPFPAGLTFVPFEALAPIAAGATTDLEALTEACTQLGASFAFVPSEAPWSERGVEVLAEAGIAAMWAIGGPLWPVVEARGTLQGLRATLTQPEQVGFELDQRLDELVTAVTRGARLGAKAVVLAEDLAGTHGPLVAPDFAIAELMPRYERIVRAARSLGMPAVFHSDGDVRPLIGAVAKAGFAAVHAGGGLGFDGFERIYWAAREVGLAVIGGLATTELVSPLRAEALGSKLGVLARAGGLFVADDGGITEPGEVSALVTALAAARAG